MANADLLRELQVERKRLDRIGPPPAVHAIRPSNVKLHALDAADLRSVAGSASGCCTIEAVAGGCTSSGSLCFDGCSAGPTAR